MSSDFVSDIEHVSVDHTPAEPVTGRQVVMWIAIGAGFAAAHLAFVAVAARL